MPEKRTPSQDRLAKRAEKAERYTELSKRPNIPWVLGKLAAFEAWRQRPWNIETRLAIRSDNLNARSQQRSQQLEQKSAERLAASIGKYQRMKAGEPSIVPQSNEVISFAYQQEVAELDIQANQPTLPPEAPEQK